MRNRRSPFERTWNKFTIGDDCWDWTASVDRDGYGRVSVDGMRARNAAYELRRPPRVYPKKPRKQREPKLFCKSGHSFDEANTIWGEGRRSCRACARENSRRHEERKRERFGRSPDLRVVSDRTHCRKGHPYDNENTYWFRGQRKCRACQREAEGRRVAKPRQETAHAQGA